VAGAQLTLSARYLLPASHGNIECCCYNCDRANLAAVNSVSRSSQRQAQQCEAAKAELVAARNDEEADLASRKISLLCDG